MARALAELARMREDVRAAEALERRRLSGTAVGDAAAMFVEGFFSVSPERASAQTVGEMMRAGGNELLRIQSGYDSVAYALARGFEVRLSAPVERVRWQKGRVQVRARTRGGHLDVESRVADWGADPFSRGGYVGIPTGAQAWWRELARPEENTLFFAGEHTHLSGEAGTVHGAIATGERAARELLDSS